MMFGLLLSKLPHVNDARGAYDAALSIQPRASHGFAAFWHSLKVLIS